MAILDKNGVMTTNTYYEDTVYNLANFDGWSYTPAKDAQNSCCGCGGSTSADFTSFINSTEDLKVHIECDFTYSNFAIGTVPSGGTWRCYWQGANYKNETGAYAWEGANYITSALNSQMTPANVVTSGNTATYHYSTEITIPASWFATYSRSQVGFRTDYSSGTGKITVTNMKIVPYFAYGGNTKFTKKSVSGMGFYEI